MEETDIDLIQGYLAGDDTNLDTLIKRHERVAYSFAYKILQNEPDAVDVVQESFVKVWKNLKKFKEDRSFRTWMLSIVHNTAIDFLRAKKRFIPFSTFEDEDNIDSFQNSIIDETPLPDEIFSKAETKKEVEDMLASVSEDRKTLILMHVVDELSFEEIGEILGKSINTVKSQYRRALQLIKERNAPKH